MRNFMSIIVIIVAAISGSSAYAYIHNFQPGPFPYPYPNTLDDYPNTQYCYAPANYWYPSYQVEGVIVPYTQPDGRVVYYWSYNKTSCIKQPVSKIKPSGIFPQNPPKVKYTRPISSSTDSIDMPALPVHRHISPREYKYKWGRPF